MNKLLLLASVAAFAAGAAAPAFAAVGDTVGEVVITGTVTSKCAVIVPGANPDGDDFGSAINLGELDQTDGTLKPTLSGSASGSPAGGLQQFRINCTGANNAISLSATPIASASPIQSGYANTINYTAEADYLVVGGTSPVTQVKPSDGTTYNSALGAGVRLANAANNVTIQAYALHTPNAGDILVAGSDYRGVITVTISPGA